MKTPNFTGLTPKERITRLEKLAFNEGMERAAKIAEGMGIDGIMGYKNTMTIATAIREAIKE